MLKVEKLFVSYGKKEVLSDISFSLKPHTLNCIIGKNGSGKTTLLSALGGERCYKGEISFCDKNLAMLPLRERAKLISLLPQVLPPVGLQVEELVEMGRTPYLDMGQRLSPQDKQAVNEAMELLDIKHLKNERVDCISGGERQKAYIAMVIAQQTRLIAFDEPTTYLDAEHRRNVCDILLKLKKEKRKTVLAVMHDISTAVEIADNIIVLDKGKLVFSGDAHSCIESEVIERTFKVKKYIYETEKGKRILYR